MIFHKLVTIMTIHFSKSPKINQKKSLLFLKYFLIPLCIKFNPNNKLSYGKVKQ